MTAPALAPPPRDLRSLTGMRFAAAALVFLSHVVPATAVFASPITTERYQTLFDRAGFVGVSFFFVLSGFVLTWSARSTGTVTGFWRRRLCKIFPNHLVTSAAAFALLAVVAGQAVDGRVALVNVALLQTWFPSLEMLGGNFVAWSLSCELLFYLCFPALLALVRRIHPRHLAGWAAGTVAAVALMPAVAGLLPQGPQLSMPPVSTTEFWMLFMFPPVRMLEFLFGILLARLVLSGRGPRLRLPGALVLAVAAYAAGSQLPGTYAFAAVMIVPLGLIITAGAVADATHRPTWMARRPMVWLGEVSFAFYMVHFLVLSYGAPWLTGGTQLGAAAAAGVIALLFAVALVLAWLLYVLVERPFMRRFASPRRRGSAVTAAAPADAVVPLIPAADAVLVPLIPAADAVLVPLVPAADAVSVPLVPARDAVSVPVVLAADAVVAAPGSVAEAVAVTPLPVAGGASNPRDAAGVTTL